MTIRELQYEIQHAIDEVPGISDAAEVCVSDNEVGCIDVWDGKKTRHVFGTLPAESVQLSPLQITSLNEIARGIHRGDYLVAEFYDLNVTERAYLIDTLKKTYNIEIEKEG